tara:strand:+ start:174 stop:623 length:450 start_codon:yes stop_codon:yes gene_type:complete
MHRRNDKGETLTGVGGRMAVLFGFIGCFFFLPGITVAQEHPSEPHRHPEAQAIENPLESTADSRRIGRQRYVFMCRECHGNSGRGDGDMSHAGGVPSDFTDDVWQHGESDGELFTVIKDGVTADMQSYANRLSDEDIWHVVNYLRSLAE